MSRFCPHPKVIQFTEISTNKTQEIELFQSLFSSVISLLIIVSIKAAKEQRKQSINLKEVNKMIYTFADYFQLTTLRIQN